MNQFLTLLLLLTLTLHQSCDPTTSTQLFQYDKPTSISEKNLKELTCSKDTQIDFNLPQGTAANLPITPFDPTASTYQYAKFNNNGGASLQFRNGNGPSKAFDLDTISLSKYSAGARVAFTGQSVTPDFQLSMTFKNNNEMVVVSLLLLDSATSVPDTAQTVVTSSSLTTYPKLIGLYELITNLKVASDTLYGLGGLSILNDMDFGNFYTIQTDQNGCKVNYLVNKLFFKLPSTISISQTGSPYTTATTSNQAVSGNLLCYGSTTNFGLFETQMRDNYGLWVAWWSSLIFWVSILYGQANSINCYDKKFSENKMTNWGLYSLFYLAHEQFFSRMMRMVPLYMSFCAQACIAAILYSTIALTIQEPVNIIIIGAISWACSLPLQWFFGLFTKPQYNASITMLQNKKLVKASLNKESDEVREAEQSNDAIEERIYSCYYWMYTFALVLFVTFVTLTVNRLQQLPRELIYQQKYWLAAVGVATILDNFVFDPLMSFLLGNTRFYRFRPYFYDGRLGESFKQLDA